MIVKNGNVWPAQTPSLVSGVPATRVEDGEPLGDGEQVDDPGLRKAARQVAALDTQEANES